MPRPHSFVGGVVQVQRRDEGAALETAAAGRAVATVRLATGQSAWVDASEARAGAWLSVLDSLRAADLPAYVEVDPISGALVELLVPLRVTVGEIHPTDEGDAVEVELLVSQARHYLRRDNPDYDELLGLLEQARADGRLVLVTENVDGTEIIDVRDLPKGLAALPVPEMSATELEAEAEVTVAPSVANQMFSLANGRTCCSACPSAPCIPFSYPDDGCWGRAHEMCRLMIAAGVEPAKIWIYGSLRVGTANNPACEVRWGWHVAPVLRVENGSATQIWVIDPSLFPKPVPQATWVGVQGDAAARTALSSAAAFYRTEAGAITLDPSYSETNNVLTTYRARLQLRSASSGPPPYAQCMARPPGVQWFGTLEPATTRRWFTFGWPANWHVVWSVMPLSICPGEPQLTWSVAVERADSGRATYWISVRNLTSRTVRFEGRYDVLS